MGVRFPSVASTTIVGIYGAAGTEAVVVTTPPLTLPLDFALVIVLWYVLFQTGAGTTSYIPRLRRGTTTAGTLLNSGNAVTVAAATQVICSGTFTDTPGAVAGQQYSLTLSGGGTTGAGTALDTVLIAYAL